MKNNVSIRLASKADAKAVFDFLCMLEKAAFDYEEFLKLYSINIADPDWIYLVAIEEKGNQTIGYVSCHGQLLLHHMGKVYEIQEMYVDKDYRGAGVGKLLIQALEEQLRIRDYVSVEVTTNKNREDAIRFYSACGFEQTHLKFTKAKS